MAPRLKLLKIEKLFGLYSYSIPLNVGERITAIIGPNGRGKTVCLRLIEALFKKHYDYFVSIPFDSLEFRFTDGSTIRIERTKSRPQEELPLAAETGERDIDPGSAGAADDRSLSFKYIGPNADEIPWTPGVFSPRVRRQLARLSPFRYAGRDTWIDPSDGEEITTPELLRRFQGRMSPSLRQMLSATEPEQIRNLLGAIDCQLIETQRLLVLRAPRPQPDFVVHYDDDDDEYVPPFPRRVRQSDSHLAIQQKAEKLAQIFRSTLAQYATLSQSLDRTFPRRVIAQPSAAPMTQAALREALGLVDARRNDLMSAGILDRDFEPVSIVGEAIEPGVAKVLEVYVKDANEKLAVFDSLRARVALFKELIETRFLDKKLEINREDGFKIISLTDNEIPLETLSSGEQHQLMILTDFHDLDLTVLLSPALKVFLDFRADRQKFREVANEDAEVVGRMVIKAAQGLGYCRWFSLKQRLMLDFKDMTFDFIDQSNLGCDHDAMINEIISKSPAARCTSAQLSERLQKALPAEIDLRQLVNGHDAATVLGIALRQLLATRHRLQTWRSEIEAGLRMTFDYQAFRGSSIYRSFVEWEASNPRYKVLKNL